MSRDPTDPLAGLSAREREVMDIVIRLRRATAVEVRSAMTDPPTDATVRSTLRALEEKGWVQHGRDGARFIYEPLAAREAMKTRALSHVVRTFFDGSASEVVSALLGSGKRRLSAKDREQIRELLRQAEDDR